MKLLHIAAVTAIAGVGVAAACYAYADHGALRQRIRNLLRRVLPILKASGARHFLAFGTLLGHIRNGDVIEGDTDGDIGLLASDAPMVFACKGAFLAAMVDLEVCGNFLMRLRDRSAPYVYVDLYLLDESADAETLGRALWATRDKSAVFPVGMVLPLRDTSFLGVSTMMPSRPKRLLRHIYGESWRIPKRHDKGVCFRFSLTRAFGVVSVFRLGAAQLAYGK
jgi:hypothetical protein